MKRLFLIFLGGALLLNGRVEADWVIKTISGNGAPGQGGDFGKALSAQLDNPLSVTRGPDQSLWFCEASGHRVRWIRPDGVIFTFAGNGKKDFSGDRGPAAEASLSSPHEVKFDANGDLYIADTGNHAIRKVEMKTRTIRTIAGTGFGKYSGDGDLATVAHLRQPSSIQFGPDGALYICDMGNHAIRRVDMQTGIITTVAGTGKPGPTVNGAPAKATPIQSPRCIDFDREGNLWLTRAEGNQIYKIDMEAKRIYVMAGTGEKGFTGHGGPALMATFNGPKCLALDAENNVWIADTENNAIRMIDAKTGNVELVAGTGARGDGPEGDPLACKMARVHGVTVDKDGSILVADSETHRIRMIQKEDKSAVASAKSKLTKGQQVKEVVANLSEVMQKDAPAKVDAGAKADAGAKEDVAAKLVSLSKEESAARLDAALKAEDAAKRQAIAALEEDVARKTRFLDEKDLELAKRQQALDRKAQERKMQELGLKERERLLKEMEGKEQALAARERELGLRRAKENGAQMLALEQRMKQKKRELSGREIELERKAQELRLMELEHKEQELAMREQNLKRRSDDLRLRELERREQDLASREEQISRKTQMLKLWDLERNEQELEVRAKALATREQALKVLQLERQEDELSRREMELERRSKELALRELERQEEELANREAAVDRRMKELASPPPVADPPKRPAPAPSQGNVIPLLQPVGSDSPVVYPLRPAKEERHP